MKRIAKFHKVSWEQFRKDWVDTFGEQPEEKIREIYEGIKLPKRATRGSAGYDFFTPVSFCASSFFSKNFLQRIPSVSSASFMVNRHLFSRSSRHSQPMTVPCTTIPPCSSRIVLISDIFPLICDLPKRMPSVLFSPEADNWKAEAGSTLSKDGNSLEKEMPAV